MTQFIKALDESKIRQLFNDVTFTDRMTKRERAVWTSFRDVCQNFLGNKKSQNYKKLFHHMINKLEVLGCNMTIQMHFLNSHIDFLPEKLGDFSEGLIISERQGELTLKKHSEP